MPTASRSNGRRVLSRRCGAMGEDHLPRLGFVGIGWIGRHRMEAVQRAGAALVAAIADPDAETARGAAAARSEEHTSELQSRGHLVCRLLLEKKNKQETDVSRAPPPLSE